MLYYLSSTCEILYTYEIFVFWVHDGKWVNCTKTGKIGQKCWWTDAFWVYLIKRLISTDFKLDFLKEKLFFRSNLFPSMERQTGDLFPSMERQTGDLSKFNTAPKSKLPSSENHLVINFLFIRLLVTFHDKTYTNPSTTYVFLCCDNSKLLNEMLLVPTHFVINVAFCNHCCILS